MKKSFFFIILTALLLSLTAYSVDSNTASIPIRVVATIVEPIKVAKVTLVNDTMLEVSGYNLKKTMINGVVESNYTGNSIKRYRIDNRDDLIEITIEI